jgi:hypothetical protein
VCGGLWSGIYHSGTFPSVVVDDGHNANTD